MKTCVKEPLHRGVQQPQRLCSGSGKIAFSFRFCSRYGVGFAFFLHGFVGFSSVLHWNFGVQEDERKSVDGTIFVF